MAEASASSPAGAALSGEEKRELLAGLLKERVRCARSYPTSFAQEQLWVVDQLDPGPVYNIFSALPFPGAPDQPALRRALAEVVRRHEALRTTFHAQGGQPVQRIAPAGPLALPVADLRALPPALREAEAARLIAQEKAHRFDLARGPLLRALLVLQEREHLLLLVVHHIVSDGWSVGVLARELGVLYEAFAAGRPSPLPVLPLQYADFALRQREQFAGGAMARQLAYWTHRLSGAPELLRLPLDRPRPRVRGYAGAWQPVAIGSRTTAGLQALGRRERVTPFMTLLAAFAILLYRYSGQTDIVVGTPIANRRQAETEALIGFFVNMLVLRIQLDPRAGALEVVRQVREVTLAAYEHADLPFETLAAELRPQRDGSHSPLFQVAFALHNLPGAAPAAGAEPPPGDEPPPVHPGSAKFDLTLFMSEAGDWLSGAFEYSTDLFEHATIGGMIGDWRTLLAAIAADPQCPIAELPLPGAAQRERLRPPGGPEPAGPRVARRAVYRPAHAARGSAGRRLVRGAGDRADRRRGRLLRPGRPLAAGHASGLAAARGLPRRPAAAADLRGADGGRAGRQHAGRRDDPRAGRARRAAAAGGRGDVRRRGRHAARPGRIGAADDGQAIGPLRQAPGAAGRAVARRRRTGRCGVRERSGGRPAAALVRPAAAVVSRPVRGGQPALQHRLAGAAGRAARPARGRGRAARDRAPPRRAADQLPAGRRAAGAAGVAPRRRSSCR